MTDAELIVRLRALGRDFDDWDTAADRIEALNAERAACAVLVSDLLDGYGTDQIDFATFEAVSAAAEAFVARARKGV